MTFEAASTLWWKVGAASDPHANRGAGEPIAGAWSPRVGQVARVELIDGSWSHCMILGPSTDPSRPLSEGWFRVLNLETYRERTARIPAVLRTA